MKEGTIPNPLELGAGYSARPYGDGEGTTAGLIVEGPAGPDCQHPEVSAPGKRTGRCSGSVPFAGEKGAADRPSWTVVQEDPLTLSPSIACACNAQHGFIRDGRWENAE